MAFLMGVVGSALMLRYDAMDWMTGCCLTVLAVSLVIGLKTLVDLYAKLIGVEDVFGSLNGSQGRGNSLLHHQHEITLRRMSVSQYLNTAVTYLVVIRVLQPFFTWFLLLHGGPQAIFCQTLVLLALSLVLLLLKFDALQPHSSYLFLK